MKDLARLTEKCHENGMNVCMDFVMNHTSEEHEGKTCTSRRRRIHEPLFLL